MSLNPDKLKVGEIIARTIYGQVLEVRPGERLGMYSRFLAVKVRDLKGGGEFYIEGQELLSMMTSADQFDQEESASRTEVVEVLVNAGPRPFTVCFTKANGSERTLRGIMTEGEALRGRSTVIDLEVVNGSPVRQVDHRTVKWLVLDGVKYTVRKRRE